MSPGGWASNPQCSFHWPSADKGRFDPLDVKHSAGYILHQDAQNMSTASAEVPEFQPPSVTIGDHIDANFKGSSTVYHSGTKVLKVAAIEVGRSHAGRENRETNDREGMGENQEGGIWRRTEKKGSEQHRGGAKRRRGEEKAVQEQKDRERVRDRKEGRWEGGGEERL